MPPKRQGVKPNNNGLFAVGGRLVSSNWRRKNNPRQMRGNFNNKRKLGGKATTIGFNGEFGRKFSMYPPTLMKIIPSTQKISLAAQQVVASQKFGEEAVFSLNSLYKPLWGGGGVSGYAATRALGYDNLFLHYRNCNVYAVKVELEWYDPNKDGLVVGCWFQGSGQSSTLPGVRIQELDAKVLGYSKDISGTGSQKVKQSFFLPLHKIEGISKTAFNINHVDYVQTVNTSPIQQPWLRLGVANSRGVLAVNDPGTVECLVRINYYCRFSDRIPESIQTYVLP